MGAGQVVNQEVAVGALPSSEVSRRLIAAGEAAGYDVTAAGPSQFQFSRQYRPGWVIPVAVIAALLTLGLGLLLLLVVKKETETCSVRVIESAHGTSLKLLGVASAELESSLLAVASTEGAGLSRAAPPGAEPSPPPPPAEVPVRDVKAPPAAGPAPIASVPGVVPSAMPSRSPEREDQPRTGERPVPSTPPTIAGMAAPAPASPAASIRVAGISYPLEGGIVMGRDPIAPSEVPSARVVQLADRSLSKTHCAVRWVGGRAEVMDLSSTNGTSIRRGGRVEPCPPGTWCAVSIGDDVLAGDQVGVVL